MFGIKYRKTKDDLDKEYKSLEKQTAKKIRQLRKEEARMSEEDKISLRNSKFIILVYLVTSCLLFFTNVIAGFIFPVAAAPLLYLYFKKKYVKQAVLIPVFAGCIMMCFLCMKGGDLLLAYSKYRNHERQLSNKTDIRETMVLQELFYSQLDEQLEAIEKENEEGVVEE